MKQLQNQFIFSDEFSGNELICRRHVIAASYLKGEGIEIGALHKPLQVPKDKCIVRYVDYKTLEENRKQYPELAQEAIVTTDYIDDGFILRKISDNSQDFIISNHAIEHSPDPLGTLIKWHSKLKQNGVLYIGVPIAEKCFDKGRKITTLEHLICDHELFSSRSKDEVLKVTEEHILDFAFVSDKNIRIINNMESSDEGAAKNMCDFIIKGLDTALSKDGQGEDFVTAHVIHVNKVYDIHYHTFTPSSYELFISYFCLQSNSILEGVFKNGNGECIAIVRKQ